MKNINIEKLSFDINLKKGALKEINDHQVNQELVSQIIYFLNQYSREVFNKSLKIATYKQEIKKLQHQLNYIKNET